VGALQLADTYFSRVWGPQRPATPPKLPAEARRGAPGAAAERADPAPSGE
jgi:hypothetical protein